MKPKADSAALRARQKRLLADTGAPLLIDFIDKSHPLVLLADRIDWSSFDPHWSKPFGNSDGPYASSARLVAGLLMRKHAEQLIAQAKQIITQAGDPNAKNKLYSLHEPGVDCIAKGKARQRYEFGAKVGITTTQKEGFVLGMRSYPGNPYDGDTLDDLLQQAATITRVDIDSVVVDLGYRGKHETQAKVIHRGRKLSKREKKRLRRRSGLEAMIGHMKNDGLLDRCHLKGVEGDAIHALLCGIGHNLRLMLNFLRKQLRDGVLAPVLALLRGQLSALKVNAGQRMAA